ncbi:pantetheine-phosphate adenylyltransferase [Luteipulveratus flavus]|uniref:Phosphopantetheine adenylyltransferase n=1 Tax=Luteipulveratus flavus TaxID=3031728 RepID=A0ABT6C4N0_9MICO|nr:pantetheine-phosphate adenylyltransferase [Luteipulveratus sp. YIM 133296]MDF8263783.1 pantetheine-phosphate adenylyltransferase [Luteipulveratus sp. YIM 133296]
MSGNPRRCVCPGSYDPMTNGHLDVVTRASALFEEVVVALLYNPDKHGTFSPQERLELIEKSVAHLPNVRAEGFGKALVVDVCEQVDAGVLLKGIRGDADYDYELPMALMNREMTGVETLMLPGDPRLGHYSSSLIRLIASHGADVSAMVPEPVLQPLLERLRG